MSWQGSDSWGSQDSWGSNTQQSSWGSQEQPSWSSQGSQQQYKGNEWSSSSYNDGGKGKDYGSSSHNDGGKGQDYGSSSYNHGGKGQDYGSPSYNDGGKGKDYGSSSYNDAGGGTGYGSSSYSDGGKGKDYGSSSYSDGGKGNSYDYGKGDAYGSSGYSDGGKGNGYGSSSYNDGGGSKGYSSSSYNDGGKGNYGSSGYNDGGKGKDYGSSSYNDGGGGKGYGGSSYNDGGRGNDYGSSGYNSGGGGTGYGSSSYNDGGRGNDYGSSSYSGGGKGKDYGSSYNDGGGGKGYSSSSYNDGGRGNDYGSSGYNDGAGGKGYGSSNYNDGGRGNDYGSSNYNDGGGGKGYDSSSYSDGGKGKDYGGGEGKDYGSSTYNDGGKGRDYGSSNYNDSTRQKAYDSSNYNNSGKGKDHGGSSYNSGKGKDYGGSTHNDSGKGKDYGKESGKGKDRGKDYQAGGKAGTGKGGGAQSWSASSSSSGGAAQSNSWGTGGKGLAAPVDKDAEFKAKLAQFSQEFEGIERVAKGEFESTKAVLENEQAAVGALKSALESSEKHQTKINDLMKRVSAESLEAKKYGCNKELGDLIQKVKDLWMTANSFSSKLKPRAIKAQAEAGLKEKDAKDSAAFASIFAELKKESLAAEAAVTDVTKRAGLMVSSPGEDGDDKDNKIAAIEADADAALKKVALARSHCVEKLTTVHSYAPEARKTSLASLQDLQKKCGDAVRTVTIYKHFKIQLPKLIANEQAYTVLSDKLQEHEAAATKAGALAKGATLTKSKLEEIEKLLEPVEKAIADVTTGLAKIDSGGAPPDKIFKIKGMCESLKKKAEDVFSKIRVHPLRAEIAVEAAKELFEKCGVCWKACQQAEMPFLMGVEVLPKEEHEQALEECKEVSAAALAAGNDARVHIILKLAQAKSFEEPLATSTAEELNKVLKNLEEYDEKTAKFASDLAERRVAPMIAESVEASEEFAKKVRIAESAGRVLLKPGLETESIETINKAVEKLKTVLGEASTSHTKARSTLQKNQIQAQAKDSHPSIVQIKQGLSEGQENLNKLRTSLTKGEQIVKAKIALANGEEKSKEVEDGLAKAKELAPKKGQPFSGENVASFNEACAAVLKMSQAAIAVMRPVIIFAPTNAKVDLQKLLDRSTAIKTEVEELKKDTKDQCDDALCNFFLEEAEGRAKAAESMTTKLDEAEGPFVIGTELGDSKNRKELLAKCTEAAKSVREAMVAVRGYTAQKTAAIKNFDEAAGKKVKDGFAELAERMKKIQEKLATFEKDTERRSLDSLMVSLTEKAEELEASLKRTLAASEPFNNVDADSLSEADLLEPLKAFSQANKDTQDKMASLTTFAQQRIKEQKDSEENMEILKKVQARVKDIREETSEVKKAVVPHEKRALGIRLLAEAKEQVGGLDAEVKKASDVCAGFLEDGGKSFLVRNSIRLLSQVLQDKLQEKASSIGDAFKEINKGKAIAEKVFVKYLTDLAGAHDELSTLDDERRLAMFKVLSSSSKGISAEDFENLFRQEYICTKQVVLTDKFEVEGSETLCKVEPQAVVELFGLVKEDEAGLKRSECKFGDKTGWITIRQKAQIFLSIATPYKTHSSSIDKALAEGNASVSKVSAALASKLKEGGPAEEGTLKTAREEMTKMKDDVKKAQKAIEELRKKVADARKALIISENTERNALMEAKNGKEAGPFLQEPRAKLEAVVAEATAAEEAAAPMVSLTADALQEFSTPGSVLESIEKHLAAAKGGAEAARESVKTQTQAVTEVSPQTLGTGFAKASLKSILARIEELLSKATKAHTIVRQKCKSLVNTKMEPVAEAIRKHATKKEMTMEALFDSLSSGDKIPEAAFCEMLTSLETLQPSLSAELAKLVCRTLQADGVSKDTFTKFVVLYYKVVRTIALTDGMDTSTCKTLRRAEEGEILEALEGPITDASSGMTRVRVRSTKKDDTITGWVTVSGSKGTPFLEKVASPAGAAA